MRITHQMMTQMINHNLARSLERMLQAQNQVATGKRISGMSDDPVDGSQSMLLRSNLADIEQYLRNATQAKGLLSMTESALGAIGDRLQEARRIAVSGASDTMSQEQRSNLALQVGEIISDIVRSGNTTYMDRRIFAGHQTLTDPVAPNPAGPYPYRYAGDAGIIRFQVDANSFVTANITAQEIFNFGGALDSDRPDMLGVLEALRQDLLSGNGTQISARIAQIDKAAANVLNQRAGVGVRLMQLESQANRLETSRITLNEWLSQTEDVDIAEAITRLRTEENVYQAGLASAARMDRLTLADYLR